MTAEASVITFLRLQATFTRGSAEIFSKFNDPLIEQEAKALSAYCEQRIIQLSKGLEEAKRAETAPVKQRKIYRNGHWEIV